MGRGAQWSAEEEAKMFCIDTVQDETRLWVGGKGKGKGKVMVEGKGKVMVASGVAVDKPGGFLEAVLWRARAKDEMPQERTGASFIDECSEDEVWANDMIKLKVQCSVVGRSWLLLGSLREVALKGHFEHSLVVQRALRGQ